MAQTREERASLDGSVLVMGWGGQRGLVLFG
jgi:hypothetical protein